MTVVATHAPGTFCWADLGTPDAAAAKRFYTALFGWDFDDMPMGDGAYYTMFEVGGKPVAALYQQDPQQRRRGFRPTGCRTCRSKAPTGWRNGPTPSAER